MSQPQQSHATSHQLHDLVTVHEDYARPSDFGVVYKITAVPQGKRSVNYVATPVNGGRGLKGKAFVFAPYAGEVPEAGRFISQPVPYAPPIWPGQVVTVSGPDWSEAPETLFVAVGMGDRKVRLARLGGTDGRVWTLPNSWLTVVDFARLHVLPAAA
ncbi:hypothetical protein CLV92_1252 [Kineococcus xinjiangensis]|uniref:Uncharacterized protein n=1 Tax=Kineococcus xinjiangensis TaxID=512762 RepID=A0A2S6IC08_9ACTN|nr:hypothetical protein [Kineococcus xinjiangensis]PPK90206.1 hypothetical protein CLV92_1252 [Kineococcus xinjiangensis]